MLTLPSNARIFVYRQPINMRKSFEGLSAIIEEIFPGELLSGSFFVFLNRLKSHIKVLFWDGDEFVIFYKRLEKGSFACKWGKTQSLDRRSFFMLLEGMIPKRLHKRFSL